MRILVTGSREFASPNTIREELAKTVADQPGPHTLVHGDAKGADRMAARIARSLGWAIEAHPADWNQPCTAHCTHRGGRRERDDGTSWCPSAGAKRNREMCELGADLVLAFYARGARNVGTADCVKSAGENGIPVRRFTA